MAGKKKTAKKAKNPAPIQSMNYARTTGPNIRPGGKYGPKKRAK